MKKTIIAILQLQLVTPTLPAAVPLRWTVETSRVQPAVFEAYQGETLTFEAALQSHGKPLAAPVNYSFFWQTNGMGSTYWEAPAQSGSGVSPLKGGSVVSPLERGSGVSPLVVDTNVLFATWLPAYDVGARVYNCFIGSPSNIYHAAFQLRLRPSPGALPNALPLPTPVIDFARVHVLNPPWGSGGGGGCDTNAVDILANSAVVTNALTVATTNRVAALETHVENTDNPHAVTAEQVGAVPFVADKDGNKTAVMIGSRKSDEPVGWYSLANGNEVIASGYYSHAEGNSTTASYIFSHAEGKGTTAPGDSSHAEGSFTTASGNYSHTEGYGTTASGEFSHAEGSSTTASGYSSHAEGYSATASGDFSHAEGYLSQTKEEDIYAFAWNGDDSKTEEAPYKSNGPGTFNINPLGGLDGFHIGDKQLSAIILGSVTNNISATNPTFSSAVLAVNLDFATNTTGAAYVAVTNALAGFGFDAEALAELPGGKVYGSIGALLAALAAAVAWLKKKALIGGLTGGVPDDPKVHDFFTNADSFTPPTDVAGALKNSMLEKSIVLAVTENFGDADNTSYGSAT